MVKYIYDKYNSIGTIGSYKEQSTPLGTQDLPYNYRLSDVQYMFGTPAIETAYGARILNEQSGLYAGDTVMYPSSNYQLNTVYDSGKRSQYYIDGTNVYYFVVSYWTTNVYRVVGVRYTSVPGATTYSRGSLIQSNVIAEDGTYPANGRHTDGFWYVRGVVSNTAPTTPGVFSQPSGTLETGDVKVV